MFSLESPHQGDSNENTQHTIISIKKKIILNYARYNNVSSYGIFSKGVMNEFEIAVLNEPSVFEPLKFCCIQYHLTIPYLSSLEGEGVEVGTGVTSLLQACKMC